MFIFENDYIHFSLTGRKKYMSIRACVSCRMIFDLEEVSFSSYFVRRYLAQRSFASCA